MVCESVISSFLLLSSRLCYEISQNVILKENNVIDNSKIGKDSCVSGSVLTGSIIGSSVYISSFCEIVDSYIGDESIINSHVVINNHSVGARTKVPANQVLGDTNDSNNRIG